MPLSASASRMSETRSRTNSGPRRFIGGAAMSTKRTAPSRLVLSVSKIMDISCSGLTLELIKVSPSSTRRRTSGHEDAAHDQDPCEADKGRDDPRIDTVWCPESTAHRNEQKEQRAERRAHCGRRRCPKIGRASCREKV